MSGDGVGCEDVGHRWAPSNHHTAAYERFVTVVRLSSMPNMSSLLEVYWFRCAHKAEITLRGGRTYVI